MSDCFKRIQKDDAESLMLLSYVYECMRVVQKIQSVNVGEIKTVKDAERDLFERLDYTTRERIVSQTKYWVKRMFEVFVLEKPRDSDSSGER